MCRCVCARECAYVCRYIYACVCVCVFACVCVYSVFIEGDKTNVCINRSRKERKERRREIERKRVGDMQREDWCGCRGWDVVSHNIKGELLHRSPG